MESIEVPYRHVPPAVPPPPYPAWERENEDAPESQLRRYLDVLRRRWRVVAGFALASTAVMALFCFVAERWYTATAVLHVRTQPPNVTSIPQVVAPPTYLEGIEYFQDQIKVLESKTLAARVIKELDLEHNPVFAHREPGILEATLAAGVSAYSTVLGWLRGDEPEGEGAASAERVYDVPSYLIGRYRQWLEVKPVMNSRMVEVRFVSPSASLSQRIANAHVRGYIHQGLQSKFQLTGEARAFLEQEIDRVREHLQKAERALNDFRRQHQVVSFDERENASFGRLIDLSQRLTEAEAARIAAEADYRLLQGRDHESLPAVIGSALIQGLKQEVSRLEVREAELAAVFLPGSPQVQEVRSQLSSARRRLARELDRVAAGVESVYLAAVARETELRREFELQQHMALDLKELSGQYMRLDQDVTSSRNLYGTLLTRLQETDVVKGVQLASASLMDPADRPGGFSHPAILFNLAFALVFGSAIGLLVALLLESIDASLKSPREVRAHLQLPTLGVVPDVRRVTAGTYRGRPALTRSTTRRSLVPAPAERLVRTEAFRSIRTSILFFNNGDRPPRTILVTSSQPQEGKTWTTVHLALSLAQLGTRVVLVDADMRQPRCHRELGIDAAPGLAEVLRGTVRLPDAVQRHGVADGRVHAAEGNRDYSGLHVLQAGRPPADPSALLASPVMEEVLAALTAAYELVLVDSPPVFPITDSAILAPRVDGVILVVRGHTTDRNVTREALERLRFMHARVLGVVLNGVDPTSSEYRSYSGYYFAA